MLTSCSYLCLRSMPFNYSAYLSFAQGLGRTSIKAHEEKNEALSEVCARNACSRAYYAVFHGAISFLRNIDDEVIPEWDFNHDGVWKHFRVASRLDIWQDVKELKNWREWADYNTPGKDQPASMKQVFDTVGTVKVALLTICQSKGKNPSRCWFLTAETKLQDGSS